MRIELKILQLKALTRGQGITRESMRVFIETLDLPEADKRSLLEMTPGGYTGLAEQLTRNLR
jgi:adenylosuccinate lyase